MFNLNALNRLSEKSKQSEEDGYTLTQAVVVMGLIGVIMAFTVSLIVHMTSFSADVSSKFQAEALVQEATHNINMETHGSHVVFDPTNPNEVAITTGDAQFKLSQTENGVVRAHTDEYGTVIERVVLPEGTLNVKVGDQGTVRAHLAYTFETPRGAEQATSDLTIGARTIDIVSSPTA